MILSGTRSHLKDEAAGSTFATGTKVIQDKEFQAFGMRLSGTFQDGFKSAGGVFAVLSGWPEPSRGRVTVSKETKFTPGPWKFLKGMFNHEGERGLGSIVTDEEIPWYIAKIEFDGTGVHANAHLIAAAPDMYELLAECLDIIEAVDPEYNQQELAEGRDLLAKARGEQ